MDPAARPLQLRRRIGIVLQSAGIYGHITPREALAHWAGLYPRRATSRRCSSSRASRTAPTCARRKLSGGQLRRLDFALALVGDPELIFLDEPTTGFDPEARRAAWQTIRSLRELGKTILLTTHYLDEAQALADRVAIVKDGRILAIGPPRELGVGAAQYRIAYRGADGETVERETDDPTALLHELTAEALARGERLRGALGRASHARGRLPGADRRWLMRCASAGASTASSAACSGATRAPRSSTSCCRCCSSAGGGIILSGSQDDLNNLVPAIAGMSVMSTTFTALAYNIVFLRERGVLKRIRGAPLPTISYFGGVAANAVTNTALQIAIVVLAGRMVFGIGWPKDWGSLILFVLVGVICFAALGVAFAHVIPNFESTAAYVNAVFLPVVFVSFYVFDSPGAPGFLRTIADALPLLPPDRRPLRSDGDRCRGLELPRRRSP